jgi:hypothetical protein
MKALKPHAYREHRRRAAFGQIQSAVCDGASSASLLKVLASISLMKSFSAGGQAFGRHTSYQSGEIFFRRPFLCNAPDLQSSAPMHAAIRSICSFAADDLKDFRFAGHDEISWTTIGALATTLLLAHENSKRQDGGGGQV